MKTLFQQHLTLGEGPRWCDTALWWVDILEGTLFRSQFDTTSNTLTEPTVWQLQDQVGMIGALAPTNSDAMVLATQEGWQLFSPTTGQCQLIANPRPDSSIRFNDGAVDPAGRFVAGTMSVDLTSGQGELWSLARDGSYRLLLDGLTCPNGIAWSAAGDEMYFIDSPNRAIQVFAYDLASGDVGKELRRIDVSDVDGVPDGCCLNNAYQLWVSFWGGSCVRCYDLRTKACLAEHRCPASQITANALLPDGSLFITSAGIDVDEPEAGNCFVVATKDKPLPTPAWQGSPSL